MVTGNVTNGAKEEAEVDDNNVFIMNNSEVTTLVL